MADGWIEAVRAVPLREVAAAVGLRERRGTLAPCPSCNAERRGSTDARGPVGIRPDGKGWRCHRCGAGGDAVALAAWGATGELEPRDWKPVRAWAEARGWWRPSGASPGPASPAPQPVPRAARPADPEPSEAPRRPPVAEVAALWGACVPVLEDAAVAAWLREVRNIDPATVVDRDLARALPAGAPLPAWARFMGRPWSETAHRLLVPLYDAAGALASLQGRSILDAAPKGTKAANAAGYQIAGLVMADALGRTLLAVGPPAWWLEAPRIERRLLVAEGVPDYLTWATYYADSETSPAVWGIVAGSWTAELAARVPAEARPIIDTHHDDAGDKYAAAIVATLHARGMTPERSKWKTAA